MSSSTPVVENVVVENVTVTVKEKKPRKPRASKAGAQESAAIVQAVQEVVQETVPVATAATVATAVENKPKKASKSKHVVAESTEVVSQVEPDVSSKKPRQPSLPAKYNKFLQFSYYLVQSLKDSEGNISINSVDEMNTLLHLLDNVPDQQAFVQGFFDQSKDINKALRKMVADKKKNDAKAAKLAAKPPKKNKNNTNTIPDQFVSDIVSLATNNNKPKRKYNKKNNNDINNLSLNDNNNDHDNDHDDQQLDVEVILINDTNYLIDHHKRLFDFNSHQIVGSFIDNLFVLF